MLDHCGQLLRTALQAANRRLRQWSRTRPHRIARGAPTACVPLKTGANAARWSCGRYFRQLHSLDW